MPYLDDDNVSSLHMVKNLPPGPFIFLTCKKQKEGQSEKLAPAVFEVSLAQNNSYAKAED